MCSNTLFLMNYFGIELVLCDMYLKTFDLTKNLLFFIFKVLLCDTFLITVSNKLCPCDYSVLDFESFPPLIYW